MFRFAQHDRRRRAFNESLRLQHEREINPFPLGDVETTCGRRFPGLGTIRKKRLDK